MIYERIFLGRVPVPGEVKTSPTLPARAWHYRMGGAFGLWLEADGVSIYHNGSADLVDGFLREVQELDPKITRVTPDYGEDLVVPSEDARAAFFAA